MARRKRNPAGGMAMAKRRKVNRVLGLDLGSYAVKAVEMTRRGERLLVTGYAYEPVLNPDKYAAAVKAALRSGGLRADRVAVGVSGKGTLTQAVQASAAHEEDMENVLRREAAKVSRLDLDNALFGYQLLEPGEGGAVKAIVAASSYDALDARLDILDDAGIVPDYVDTELIALANAYETANSRGHFQHPRRGVVLADIGAEKTLIAATGANVNLFREFPFGGIALTEMVARRLDIGLDEAERVKCDPGERMQVVRDAIYPGIEDLAAEIRAVAEYFRTMGGGNPALLLVSGGLAAFPAAARVLGRLAKLRSGVFDSFGRVEADQRERDFLKAYAHEFPIAFGLACRARN